MIWIVVAVLVYFLLFNKSNTPTNYKGTVTGGGTSTQVPTPNAPAFYQSDNSSPSSADNPNPPINKFNILKSPGILATPTTNPDITTNTEQSSNSSEQTSSYINNGLYTAPRTAEPISNLIKVGVFSSGDLQTPNPPFVNPIVIPKTIDSPAAVGSIPAGTGLQPAATIAPLPEPNPTFEATVPQIASAVVQASLTQDSSTSLERQRAFI